MNITLDFHLLAFLLIAFAVLSGLVLLITWVDHVREVRERRRALERVEFFFSAPSPARRPVRPGGGRPVRGRGRTRFDRHRRLW